MMETRWANPGYPELGGRIEYEGNVYCVFDIDTDSRTMNVTLPMQDLTEELPILDTGNQDLNTRQWYFESTASDFADNYYSLPQLHRDLGRIPDETEVNRIIAEYPNFQREYRKDYLNWLLSGMSHAEMGRRKYEYDLANRTKQSKPNKGNAFGWTRDKAKKIAMRLIYLKLVLDEKKKRPAAVKEILLEFPHLVGPVKCKEDKVFKATRRACDQ